MSGSGVPPRRPAGPARGHDADDPAPERGPQQGGDVGLFGPGSVTWRLHAEPLMGVAALRALLLQALHPVAVAAFEEHSTYRQDVWGRLARTAEYVVLTTFGSTTEAMLAASRVRAMHARVRGTLPTGVEYAADDPQLLAWVHCCLVASFLEVLTRGGVTLTGAEQDQYIEEQVKAAMLVGLEPDEVPHDRAALLDYFRVIKPALECTPIARQTACDVVHASGQARLEPTGTPRPAWSGLAGLAFAALPPWGRRLYALPDLPGPAGLTDAATTVGLRTLRGTLRGIQSVIPSLGEGAHLRAARARLNP
jgi:uncharacterized protein (DUF2236 family)